MTCHTKVLGRFAGVAIVTLAAQTAALGEREFTPVSSEALVLIEQGPVRTAVLRADGRKIEVQTETEWRFMCGSDTSNLTIDDLKDIVTSTTDRNAAFRPRNVRPKGARSVGFDLIFNVTNPPPKAQGALDAIEAYYEAIFTDPVTVEIDIAFASLPSGVLGSTGSDRAGWQIWDDVRNGLIADMDANDVIHDWLPTNRIPVRYDASGTSTVNESRCRFTVANFDAALGTLGGRAASMTFSTNFPWDYEPPVINANAFCFQSVAVHEIGHALGFISRADISGNSDIIALDIFRFQQSDPQWNPSSYSQFTIRTRTVDSSDLFDDSVSDIITAEHEMANNGGGDQASHFRARNPGINIMDPSLAPEETFFPNFLRQGDLDMFDAIGWDYPRILPPVDAPDPRDVRRNRYVAFTPTSGAFTAAYQVEMSAGPGTTGILGWVGTPWDPSCQKEDGSPLDGSPPCLAEDYLARVVNARVDRVWTEPFVDVGDCEIVPVAEYGIRVILNGDDDTNFLNFSPPLMVGTIEKPDLEWGDTVGQLFAFWTPAQGVVNVTDLQALLLAIQDLNGPHPSWVDVHGQGPGSPPNFILNVSDVQQIKFALEGKTFLESNPDNMDPADCP